MYNNIGKNTGNVKYIGNTWQKSGSIENATSMYMAEDLLNLLYQENSYEDGAYDYIPRAHDSLQNASPALLSHDLILVNTYYYTGTSQSTGNSIYSLSDYLKYGISVSNPVYSIQSPTKFISLMDKDRLKDSTVTMLSFINTLTAKLDLTTEDKENLYQALKNRYGYNATISTNALLTASGASAPTLKSFCAGLTDDAIETFIRDFSLPIHDRQSVKLPFYNQQLDTATKAASSNKIATRFVINSSSIVNPSKMGLQVYSYVEKLATEVEDALTAITDTGTSINFFLKPYSDKSINSNTLENTNVANQLSATDLLNLKERLGAVGITEDEGEASYEVTNLFPDNYEVDIETANRILGTLASTGTSGGFNSILPPLYVGYDTAVDMCNSNAIQLCIPQDKSTILISDESYETWSIFGGIKLGYVLIDNLIAQRTFLGTIWGCSDNPNALEDAGDLYKGIKSYLIDIPDELKYKSSDNYHSISVFNYLYNNFGAGTDTDTSMLTPPVLEWLQSEQLIIKAPIFGDFIEEKNFEQDLTPHSSPEFQSAAIDADKVSPTRYPDSLIKVPYMEQTAPLVSIQRDVLNSEAHAAPDYPSVSTFKDGARNFRTTPPFLYDSYKNSEGEEPGVETELGELQPIKKDNKGNLRVEDRIISKTIDEIWVFLKYLTEAYGENSLPSFYGMDASTFNFKGGHTPSASEKVDILSWEPTFKDIRKPLHSTDAYPELDVQSWQVKDFITYVATYQVEPIQEVLGSLIEVVQKSLHIDNIDSVQDTDPEINKQFKELLTSAKTIAYEEHPKNLKTIERDLATLKYNLEIFAKFTTDLFAYKGVYDEGTGVGTLQMLHKNARTFEDAAVRTTDGTIPEGGTIDNTVVFFDGQDPVARYTETTFGSSTAQVSANKTLRQEVYLGADGQWHSIRDGVVLPIVDDEF